MFCCRRVTIITSDFDAKMEDVRQSQLREAALVEKLKFKVVEYRDKFEASNKKLIDLSHVAKQNQIRLNDTNEVLLTLEERLRQTEVRIQ